MEEIINIVLIDHQQLFREGVKRVLQSESSFNVVASSDNYSVVSALLHSQRIDVLLVDVKTLMENKQEIKGEILERSVGSKVIVLSTEGEENFVTEAILLGVDGYLLKEMDIYTFINAVKAVHEGMSYIHPVITGPLIEGYRKLTMSEDETKVS